MPLHMFLDEPEGNSFSDLNQYLGAASALGTAIDIKTLDNKLYSGYLNHSQESLPNFIEIFTSTEDGAGKNITKISVSDIIWFKLKRYGKTESYIDEHGEHKAKLPIIIISAKSFTGNGSIINSGVTSIYSENIDFTGKISADKKEEENNESN